MSHDTRPPSPTKNLIAEYIKASFAHEFVLFSPEVLGVIDKLIPLGNPDVIVPLVHMFTAPEGIHRLSALIDRVPLEILLAAHRKLPRLLEKQSRVQALIADQDFQTSYSLRAQVELCASAMKLDQDITSILQPIMEAWERIPYEHPEIPYLEPWPKERVAQHEPRTIFMVLLTEHFRQQTETPRYRKIAEATNILFPQQCKKDDITPRRAMNRIRTFKPKNKPMSGHGSTNDPT